MIRVFPFSWFPNEWEDEPNHLRVFRGNVSIQLVSQRVGKFHLRTVWTEDKDVSIQLVSQQVGSLERLEC